MARIRAYGGSGGSLGVFGAILSAIGIIYVIVRIILCFMPKKKEQDDRSDAPQMANYNISREHEENLQQIPPHHFLILKAIAEAQNDSENDETTISQPTCSSDVTQTTMETSLKTVNETMQQDELDGTVKVPTREPIRNFYKN